MSSEGYTIDYRTIPSGSIDEARKAISEIDPYEYDITILAVQQGIGKTYFAKEWMKKDPSSAFFTSKHSLLDEIDEAVNGCTHWYGKFNINSRCEHVGESAFEYLNVCHVNPRKLCNYLRCETATKDCPHFQQFGADELVISPFFYLGTKYIRRSATDLNYKFDTFFIDESIFGFNSLDYHKDEWVDAIECMKSIPKEIYDDIIADSDNSDKYKIIFKTPYDLVTTIKDVLEHRSYDNLNTYFDFISSVYSKAEEHAYYTNNDEVFKAMCRIRIGDIRKELYKTEVKYEGNIKSYHTPYLYDVLDIAQSEPNVVMLNASYNDEMFRDLLSAYSGEKGFNREIRIVVYETKMVNLNSYVYVPYNNSHFPKSTMFVDRKGMKHNNVTSLDGISNMTNFYMRDTFKMLAGKFKRDDIGVISHKQLMSITAWGTRQFMGFDALYYYGSKGLNTLEEKKVVVLVGTPLVTRDAIVGEYNMLHLTDITIDSLIYKDAEPGKPRRIDREKQPKLANIEFVLNEAELIDNIHRIRPLVHDGKIIILFAYLPDKIRDEFTCEEGMFETDKLGKMIDDLNICDNGDNHNDRFIGIVNMINAGFSNTEIAKKYNITKKNRGFDTGYIKSIRKMIEKVRT